MRRARPLAGARRRAAPQARAPQAARPALWEVSDPDTTIYLFGTIHLLPENYQWRTPKFDQAVDGLAAAGRRNHRRRQEPAEADVRDGQPRLLRNGLPPLAQRVPPAKRAALAAAIKKSGYPPQALDRMKTWAAAFILLGNQFRDMGLKGDEGVEAVLRNSFTGEGKPIGELETNVEQLSFFDRLPESAQRAAARRRDRQPQGDAARSSAACSSAWVARRRQGDRRRPSTAISPARPSFEQALIQQRNANWSKWIEQRMAQPGAIMVAVGAGHLAGNDSVLELLKQRRLHGPPRSSRSAANRLVLSTDKCSPFAGFR